MLISIGERLVHTFPGSYSLRPEALNHVLGTFDIGETDVFAA